MSIISEIRQLTGQSYARLGAWLGVSRTLVYYSERGERDLPSETTPKLGAMILLLQKLKEEAAAGKQDRPVITSHGKLAARHKKKEGFHRRSALALQQQLRRLKALHPLLDARLALFEAMRNPSQEWYQASPTDLHWMEMTEWFSRERMRFTGLEQQELLQDKIEMHLAYAGLHKERKERFEGMG
jgi:hypothetical protein